MNIYIMKSDIQNLFSELQINANVIYFFLFYHVSAIFSGAVRFRPIHDKKEWFDQDYNVKDLISLLGICNKGTWIFQLNLDSRFAKFQHHQNW